MIPQHRWQTYKTSIFSIMSAEANAVGAVNLAQGFPDFNGPEEVIEAAAAAMKKGLNQYAPAMGIKPLRDAISRRYQKSYDLKYDSDQEVTVLTGATEAIWCAIQACCGPGDEAIGIAPFYDSYPAACHAGGATLKTVALRPPHWRVNADEIERLVTPKTKMILVNTPHNPTGRVLTRAEMEGIAAVARKYDLIVMSDEVYEEIVFAPAVHIPMASLPGMRERTITISSTSKTFSFTGWKVGYACAPEKLTEGIRRVHQFTVFCSATPLQHAMVRAFELGDDYYRQFRADYLTRRDTLLAAIRAAGFDAPTPEGTYFISGGYDKLAPATDDIQYTLDLVRKKKIALIPLSPFYLPDDPVAKDLRQVRFAFCKTPETLTAATNILSRI
jgi:N-succinyldiaminopimelate aminotransferase